MTSTLTLEVMNIDDVQKITASHPEVAFAKAHELIDVPRAMGVYAWASRDGHILYVGKAVNARNGLHGRLAEEWGGKRAVLAIEDDLTRRRTQIGGYRTLAHFDALPWFAVVDNRTEAEHWERRLLQLSVALTGVRPLINGTGWVPKGHMAVADQWALEHYVDHYDAAENRN